MSALQTRLLILWAVIAVLATRELISLPAEHDRVIGDARDRLGAMARAIGGTITSSFKAVDITLQDILEHLPPAAGPATARRDPASVASLRRMLQRHLERTPGLDALAITDAAGRVIASTVADGGEKNVGDSAYFRLLRGGVRDAPVISQALKGRIGGEWNIAMARRMTAADGRFGGALIAEIGVESHFGGYFRSLAISPTTASALIDENRRVMMHLPHDEMLLGRYVHFPIGDGGGTGGSIGAGIRWTPSITVHEGEQRLALLFDLADYPLSLGISERREVILQPWHAMRAKSVLFLVLLFTAGGLLTRRLFLAARDETRMRLAASVFAHAREGILMTEPDSTIIDCNPRLEEMTGYRRDEIIGQTPRLFSSQRHGASFYRQLWEVLQHTDNWRGEMWNRKKSGELYAQQASISAVRDDTGRLTHYVGLFTDITPLKHQADALREQANHDPLTRLPNRALLRERLQQALHRAQRQQGRVALCYVDLDEFKPINDSLGHAAGDRVLIEIAHRLRSGLRGGDTAARIGGDEFVVVLNNLADTDECRQAVERLLAALTEPIPIEGRMLKVSASIGVALYPRDADSVDDLLALADEAMYEAKRAGRNRYSECP